MGKFAGALVTVSSLLAGLTANAVPVTYDFDATVTVFRAVGLRPPGDSNAEQLRLLGLLPGSLGGGTELFFRPFSGSLTVDSDAAIDLIPATDFGFYSGFGLISAFSVSLEGLDFALDSSRAGADVTGSVLNRPSVDAIDLVAALGTGLLPGPASGLATQLRFSFFSLDANPFDSDGIPTDLSLLANPTVSIDFVDPVLGSSVGYGAQFQSLTRRITVPETSTLLLFGVGVLGLLYQVARQRSRMPMAS